VDDVGWLLLIIAVLAGGSMFFSVSCITLRIFSRAKLQELFKKTGRENLTDAVAGNAEKLTLTCAIYRLIFNVGIFLAVFVLFTTDKSVTTGNYIAAFVTTLIIFFIFSVAVPEAWAKYAGEFLLAKTYKLLLLFSRIAVPILLITKLNDSIIKRLAGVAETTAEEEQEETQEEFLTDLEQHKMEGAVDEEEQEMIENVLELSDSSVDEIMTPRTDVIAVDKNSDLKTILKVVTGAGHSRLPVYEKNIDNIVGLLYAKDLLKEIGKDAGNFNLAEKMRKPYFVPETKPLRALLHEFQNQKLHIAIVLDEYGGTAGIVTIEDIIEELVGEITDEYEKTMPMTIKKIDSNTIEVDSRTYVDDLNDKFEFNLPEDEDYDTIGGFVFSHLGYIPKANESFEYESLKFTILSAEPRKINSILIKRNPEPLSEN